MSDARPDATMRPATCPFCDSTETEQANSFGAHASVSSWWCARCRSPFEVFKWGNHADETRDDDE